MIDNTLSASEQAKEAGLYTLEEAIKITGTSRQTLCNWRKKKPELFRAVLLGCAKIKREVNQ